MRCTGGLLLAGLVLPLAAAQSNSLFGRGSQPATTGQSAPTTQPAQRGAALPPRGVGPAIRAALQEHQPEPRPNEVLLQASPYAVRLPEPEAIEVNDLVTIVVRISKSAKSDAKLESQKDWSHEWSLEEWIRYSDLHGIVPAKFSQGKPSVKFDLKNDYGGDGKYDRTDSFTTRIQARVIDVKPNGNLVLEARNEVQLSDERYTVTLTGTCRSTDITPSNTVLSSQIADLTVQVDDHGALRDATRRGWLMRFFDFVRPF